MSTEKPIYNTAEFYELMLAYLIRSKTVFDKCKGIGIKPDDFIPTSQFAPTIYKIFAEICFEINASPVSHELFGMYLRNKFDSEELKKDQLDTVAETWARIYNVDISDEAFALHHLPKFVKHRRQEKAKVESGSIDELRDKLNEIAGDFDFTEGELTKVKIYRPFDLDKPVIKEDVQLFGTPWTKLNDKLLGIGRGEWGLIIGHTGGGKTAMAVNIAYSNVNSGFNVAYISMEETAENLISRFYAYRFGISYTELYSGSGSAELTQKYNELDRIAKDAFLKRLAIFDLKGINPTAEDVFNLLERKYYDEGFRPDMVIIDQMDFLEPTKTVKDQQRWQAQEIIAKECDELISHKKIDGQHSFALWVLHQAKGKNKLTYTMDEIAGFKGIGRSADTVMCVGRDGPMSNDFRLFSLKSRHSSNFAHDLIGELQFMRFMDKAAVQASLNVVENIKV